jgi:hypothetical protein
VSFGVLRGAVPDLGGEGRQRSCVIRLAQLDLLDHAVPGSLARRIE